MSEEIIDNKFPIRLVTGGMSELIVVYENANGGTGFVNVDNFHVR